MNDPSYSGIVTKTKYVPKKGLHFGDFQWLWLDDSPTPAGYTSENFKLVINPDDVKNNTILNPLKLSSPDGSYKVNKPGEQDGEYVDKTEAVKILNALRDILELTKELFGDDNLNENNSIVNSQRIIIENTL